MELFGIIVDGYSSGKFYPSEFKKLGVKCLHIKSRANIPSFITGCFCDSAYLSSIVHESLEMTIDWIRTFGEPLFVIPGCEIGVNLADQLAHELNLENSNPIEMTIARRNKYLMLEALRKVGIRAIRQIETKEVVDAQKWIVREELKFPIVVKPLQSTSGEGFSLCRSNEDIEKAFANILSAKNLLNIENQSVLVQEYISGDEYVVDTVSSGGLHVVSDYLKYKKSFTEEGNTIYNASEFLPLNHNLAQSLSTYVFRVLDALKIVNGPSHAEVMVDSKGPVLIEVGARPAGCMLDPELIEKVYGHSQLSLSALAYCNPDKFKAEAQKIGKVLNSNLTLVFLSCYKDGIVKDVNVEIVRNLASFCKLDSHVKVGEAFKKTRNLSEAAAIVYLLHESSSVVQADVDTLLKKEREFLTMSPFAVESEKASYVQVDCQYLNYTATLCGTVKNRTYQICGIDNPQKDKKVDILDVGCGSGIDLMEMAKRVSTESILVGVDIDKELIDFARRRAEEENLHNVKFVLASSEQILGNSEFDCVRSERLFQHLKAPEITFRNMVAALKNNGRLVIADTDWSSLTSHALNVEENATISNYYAGTLTNKQAVVGLGEMFKKNGMDDFVMEKITVRLERDDYMKIIKGETFLKGAFDSEEDYRRVIVKLNTAGHLPMFASLDMIILFADKHESANRDNNKEIRISSESISPI